MNDLTFGATLLACLVYLIGAVLLETTSAPAGSAAPIVARSAATAASLARPDNCDSLTFAQAPIPAR